MTRALRNTPVDQRSRADQSSCGAISRRELLTGAAVMTGAALWDSRPTLARQVTPNRQAIDTTKENQMSTPDTTTEAHANTRPANATDLPDYAPIPRAAFGPALNEQGYYVG